MTEVRPVDLVVARVFDQVLDHRHREARLTTRATSSFGTTGSDKLTTRASSTTQTKA
jgi:hypothetical protein